MKADVDKYLAALPPEQRAVLAKLRATILSLQPTRALMLAALLP